MEPQATSWRTEIITAVTVGALAWVTGKIKSAFNKKRRPTLAEAAAAVTEAQTEQWQAIEESWRKQLETAEARWSERLDDMERKLATADQRERDCQQKNTDYQLKVGGLEAQIDALMERIRKLESELGALREAAA